jgi:hypothetical protein
VSGQLHIPTALPQGKCWMGLRAGLDVVAKRKNSNSCWESNPGEKRLLDQFRQRTATLFFLRHCVLSKVLLKSAQE